MKGYKRFLYIGILIFMVSFITGCFNFNKKVRIEDLKSFHYSYSVGYYMYANVEFDIDIKDGKYIAKIKDAGMPEEEARTYEVDKHQIQIFESMLNEINIYKWNGFNKFDKNVLDGDSFSISINWGEQRNISAHGYMMYPNGYREKTDSIKLWFSEIDKDKPKDTE